jgi:S1-C subfamily serine protease
MGEVVGINTLGFSPAGLSGVNFSLAASELAQVLGNRFGWTPSEANVPPPPIQSQLTQPQSTATMHNADIRQLHDAGISDQVITEAINSAANVQFDLDATHLIELNKAGVSDVVIQAMLRRH